MAQTKTEELTEIEQRVEPRSLLLANLRKHPEFGVLVFFFIVFLAFSLVPVIRFGTNTFATGTNLIGMFTLISEWGIIAIGATMLMISGEFDLSVGANYAVAGFLFSTLANTGLHSLLALLLTLMFTTFVGFLNGTITLRAQIPSFITTLGMLGILKGVLLMITGGRSTRYLGDDIALNILGQSFTTIVGGGGLRPSHLWFIALVVIFTYILTRTGYGNWVYATGGNKVAAQVMGVNINRVKMTNFMVLGLLSGLAGSIALSRFRLASPAFGSGLELEVIAAVVIGGTLLFGGSGTIIGTFLGTFLVAGMFRTGLLLAGAPGYWFRLFVGITLIAAAVITMRVRGKDIGI